VPHLYKLAQYPVVIHVSLHPSDHPDLSEISAVRQTGFTFLQSGSIREAQDIALTAHALAIKSGKGVIHFSVRSSFDDDSIVPEDRELVKSILDLRAARRFQAIKVGSSTLHADDGRIATITEDEVNFVNGGNGSISGLSSPQNEIASGYPKDTSTEGTSSVGSSSRRESSAGDGPPFSSATSVASSTVRPVTSEDICRIVSEIWEQLRGATNRAYHPFEYAGPADAEEALFVFGSEARLFEKVINQASFDDLYTNAGIITARLYRPWLGAKLVDTVPKSVKRIAVLEQIRRKTTKWGPVLLDLITTLKSGPLQSGATLIVGYQLGYVTPATARRALSGIFQNLKSKSPIQNLEVGLADRPAAIKMGYELEQPKVEAAYMKILNQIFGERLHIANALGANDAGINESISSNPEFGLGSLLARMERRKRFIEEVKRAANTEKFATETPRSWLSRWALAAEDSKKVNDIALGAIERLTVDGSPLSVKLLSSRSLFYKESPWLIGSDAWAYDLGNSGVHHVLASGENVNMLIIDSQPYSDRAAADAERRKKDIGLYAMNFGNAYVASTAVYSSYTQVLQAMIEADQFDGPSIVLAYLPYNKENDSPLTILQETKKAVDLGYWPLYRWNPLNEEKGEPNFSLDSERIKKELQEFLRRDNQLSQLAKRHPEFSANLSEDYGSEIRSLQKRRAKDAYNKLLEGLFGAPLTVLFASDNGNAESLAKRLAGRGKARGLKTVVMAMDDYPLEDLPNEENVVFVSSTAGQGEFPQNGRALWDAVKNSTDLDISPVNYAVFGLGDRHYWPRKEDKVYYNKPAKDLDARLAILGGKRLTDIGLGDDQDPDGYQTGYQEWEPKLWKALGVDNVEGLPEEPAPLTNEDIKIASNYLRGTIKEGLEDQSTGAISASDQQLTKFHGTYMQDDRDLRDERKAQGLEPKYIFMIRCRLPGGVATPSQWLQMDSISTKHGNETMKLTTRQTFQVRLLILMVIFDDELTLFSSTV
jgi:sulfite reductase (NADPH) hemoprotein beta-component